MDPYEYLFQKLSIKSRYNTIYETQTLYTDSIPLIGVLPECWNAARIFNHFRNTNVDWFDPDAAKLTKLLKLFRKSWSQKNMLTYC